MSDCDSKCTCGRTPKGDEMLARYAVEGNGMLNDPDVQAIIATMKKRLPDTVDVPDEVHLETLIRVLARQKNGPEA